MVLCCPYQINYSLSNKLLGEDNVKVLASGGMMVLCAFGLVAQLENEGNALKATPKPINFIVVVGYESKSFLALLPPTQRFYDYIIYTLLVIIHGG